MRVPIAAGDNYASEARLADEGAHAARRRAATANGTREALKRERTDHRTHGPYVVSASLPPPTDPPAATSCAREAPRCHPQHVAAKPAPHAKRSGAVSDPNAGDFLNVR